MRALSVSVLAALLLATVWPVTRVSAVISRTLSPSKINVAEDGKYQGLVIAISHRVEAEDRSEYLDEVERNIKTLSHSIHVTFGLQFGDVTIILPSDWSADKYVSNQKLESADMLIRPITDEIAYTEHIQGCGYTALRMVIDATTFESNGNRNLTPKFLLHQWIHARYGVFDEFPLKGKSALQVDTQEFYHSEAIEAVRCSLQLGTVTDCGITAEENYEDIVPETSLPKSECSFSVVPPSKPTPSLMSQYYHLENVDLLCNESTHNSEAPTIHNRLCDNRSVKKVMDNHQDLVRFRNSPLPISNYTDPVFRRRRLRSARTLAIVLDISNSMLKKARLVRALQAIGSMIRNIIENNVKIIIVGFAKDPHQIFPPDGGDFVVLDSIQRDNAIRSLANIETRAFTCIGCGLKYALDKLNETTVTEASLLLLTDGHDAVDVDLTDSMFDKCELHSCYIDSILLSEDADQKLVTLTKRCTGCTAFRATDDTSDLIDAFTELSINRQTTNQVVQIYNHITTIEPRKQSTPALFWVDKSLNRMAEITFYWNPSVPSNLSFLVWRQRDDYNIPSEPSNSNSLGYLTISLGAEYESDGNLGYMFRITNNHQSETQHVTAVVNSRVGTEKPPPTGGKKRRSTESGRGYEQPYNMKAYVNSETNFTFSEDVEEIAIHAYLPPGSTPHPPQSVIATVKVNSLDTNHTTEFTIDLHDAGVGADMIRGDRIYSAYFTDFQSYNATYYVRIRARGEGFMRYATTGYFAVYVRPGTLLMPVLPPVNDLEVTASIATRITLTFTKPSSKLDNANPYRVWCSTDYAKLRNGTRPSFQAHLVGNQKSSVSGKEGQEEISVDLPEQCNLLNRTVWFAITVLNKRDVQSKISNTASARYIDRGMKITLYVIVGVTGFVLIVIIIVFSVICHTLCERRKSNKNPNPK